MPGRTGSGQVPPPKLGDQVGPGIPYSQKRKNCQLSFNFDYPSGWSYALLVLDTRGYVSLERGVTGIQQTRFYFQGKLHTGSFMTNFQGPRDGDYQVRDILGLSSQVFSPCGAHRALNLNTEIRLDNSRNSRGLGLMTTDSIDAGLKHTYSIVWRRC